MMWNIFIAVALLAVVNGYQIRECKEGPLPLKLVVSGCSDNDEKCLVYRGEDAEGEITFQVPSDQDELFVKVVARVAGLPVTFPMPDPKVCNSLIVGMCPIDEGEKVTYLMKVPIQKFYPEISLDLQISILSEDKADVIACVIFPVKVSSRNRWIYNKLYKNF